MTTMTNTLLGFAEMMLALLAGALANFDNGSRGVGDVGRVAWSYVRTCYRFLLIFFSSSRWGKRRAWVWPATQLTSLGIDGAFEG